MKALLMILLLCWPFGHRHQLPQQPPRATGRWFQTPHFNDGYWVEHTAKELGWGPYPFSRYRWEWPGIAKNDVTWIVEDFPGKQQPKPKPREWIPDYDPFLPGTRNNL